MNDKMWAMIYLDKLSKEVRLEVLDKFCPVCGTSLAEQFLHPCNHKEAQA